MEDSPDWWPGYWQHFPLVVNLGVMAGLENCYLSVSQVLTRWEGHHLRSEYIKSYVMKKTLFAYMSTFGLPLYVLFAKRDLQLLKKILFITVSIKQVGVGTMVEFIPSLRNWLRDFRSKQVDKFGPEYVYQQYKLPENDIYSEYEEMALDWGFLVLFAPLCEWMALWCFIDTWIELRTDNYKFRIQRRFFGHGHFNPSNYVCVFEAASLAGVVSLRLSSQKMRVDIKLEYLFLSY